MTCGDMGCQLFGAYRCAISVKNAALLIHSTVGCNWGPLIFHMPSRVQDFRQASSVMHEDDIIYGGETILKEALDHMLIEFPANLIFVLTGCVPELIGDDSGKIISNYQSEREIIHLSAPGFKGNAYDGCLSAMTVMIHQMKRKKKRKDTVNLIGFFSDDDKVDSDLKQIISILPKTLSLNSIFPYDTWDNIQNMPGASFNIVLEGFEAVGDLLMKTFNIPYIVIRYPYGLEGSRKLINLVSRAMDIPPDYTPFKEQEQTVYQQLEQAYSSVQSLQGLPAAVLGPSWRTGGFIDMLEQELQMRVVYQTDTALEDIDKETLQLSGACVLFGNSFDKEIARRMNIPFLAMTYPVFDRISISDRSYCGAFGMVNLVEDIINTVLFPR
jgi:nitrogenase molybdenum-iron protein beta chain